ncbi:MAG: AAA family ATPase [Blastocatellia bacterium]
MFLHKLSIRNYKSLRDVTFAPSPISAVIGPNAAGKSNLASAVHFLSEVYELGLEPAIARKGGYENIAFRHKRRSKVPLSFEIALDLSPNDLRTYVLPDDCPARFIHRFSIAASGTGIGASFKVLEESFQILGASEARNGTGPIAFSTFLSVSRDSERNISVVRKKKGEWTKEFLRYEKVSRSPRLGDQDLFLKSFSRAQLDAFSRLVSGFRSYQFSPSHSRFPGVPTPNPSLSLSGDNLPAIVSWLKKERPKQWATVMSGMRDVLPGLTEISTEYLHTKTLGLFFYEEGLGRPWRADEVSDGTMQALAVLVAAVDSRSSLLLIEEPENSVHPWILRVVVDRLREVSKSKSVILTSHSPTLVNRLKPEEVWIIYREGGESKLRKLIEIDPSLEESWENGEFQLADFLDSGAIGQAVPGGVW